MVFFSTEVTGYSTVPNSAPQVFYPLVSAAVIQPQEREVPITVPVRPIGSNQHHETEEESGFYMYLLPASYYINFA